MGLYPGGILGPIPGFGTKFLEEMVSDTTVHLGLPGPEPRLLMGRPCALLSPGLPGPWGMGRTPLWELPPGLGWRWPEGLGGPEGAGRVCPLLLGLAGGGGPFPSRAGSPFLGCGGTEPPGLPEVPELSLANGGGLAGVEP